MAGGTTRVVSSALVVIPGPGETVTFVRQERGPYAGFWLLPGGKVEFGESIADAARREAAEESGCRVEELTLTGAYEILGPDHHFVVWAYRSEQAVAIPAGFHGHHVTGVQQVPWNAVEPHPTDMPILNEAGAASYPRELIEDRLQRHGITMTNVLNGSCFGPEPGRHCGRLARQIPEAVQGGADRPESPVREFTERAVGRITDWSDVSWARKGSRVWRARGAAGGVWFAKTHENDRFHDREVRAYRSWVISLETAAPRLVAADPVLRTVVTTAVPGHSLHDTFRAPDEQRRIFHSIGALAAAIHSSASAQPASGKPVLLEKLEQHLDGVRAHLALGDEEFIRATAKRVAHLPELDLVPTHGDFQLRNLLWDDDTLYVIDFERSEEGPAVRDFIRLSDAWAGRPDLYDATMAGYGRPLTPAEKEHLAVGSVLDAVSGIQYGAAHSDLELVERGRRTLTRLRAADRGAW